MAETNRHEEELTPEEKESIPEEEKLVPKKEELTLAGEEPVPAPEVKEPERRFDYKESEERTNEIKALYKKRMVDGYERENPETGKIEEIPGWEQAKREVYASLGIVNDAQVWEIINNANREMGKTGKPLMQEERLLISLYDKKVEIENERDDAIREIKREEKLRGIEKRKQLEKKIGRV